MNNKPIHTLKEWQEIAIDESWGYGNEILRDWGRDREILKNLCVKAGADILEKEGQIIKLEARVDWTVEDNAKKAIQLADQKIAIDRLTKQNKILDNASKYYSENPAMAHTAKQARQAAKEAGDG